MEKLHANQFAHIQSCQWFGCASEIRLKVVSFYVSQNGNGFAWTVYVDYDDIVRCATINHTHERMNME